MAAFSSTPYLVTKNILRIRIKILKIKSKKKKYKAKVFQGLPMQRSFLISFLSISKQLSKNHPSEEEEGKYHHPPPPKENQKKRKKKEKRKSLLPWFKLPLLCLYLIFFFQILLNFPNLPFLALQAHFLFYTHSPPLQKNLPLTLLSITTLTNTQNTNLHSLFLTYTQNILTYTKAP